MPLVHCHQSAPLDLDLVLVPLPCHHATWHLGRETHWASWARGGERDHLTTAPPWIGAHCSYGATFTSGSVLPIERLSGCFSVLFQHMSLAPCSLLHYIRGSFCTYSTLVVSTVVHEHISPFAHKEPLQPHCILLGILCLELRVRLDQACIEYSVESSGFCLSVSCASCVVFASISA